jgi:hypothetical protein
MWPKKTLKIVAAALSSNLIFLQFYRPSSVEIA